MKIVLGILIYVIAAVASGICFLHVFYEDKPVKTNDGAELSVEIVNKWLRRLAYVFAVFWPIAWSVWLALRAVGLCIRLVRVISPKTVERFKNETLEDFGIKDEKPEDP